MMRGLWVRTVRVRTVYDAWFVHLIAAMQCQLVALLGILPNQSKSLYDLTLLLDQKVRPMAAQLN